jgi:hypothetical protein
LADDGKLLRVHVGHWMEEHGYVRVHQNRFLAARILKQRMYAEELKLPNPSIYDTTLRSDFAVHNPERDSLLLIECVWQKGSGTTDQKFPYKVLNIKQRFPNEAVTVMLVDGGGFEPGAITWLESQRDEKLVEVVNRAGFHRAMKELGYE